MDGLAIARERIAREADEKTGFLDLGNLGLSEFPRELFGLPGLLRLNLGNWYRIGNAEWRPSASRLELNTIIPLIERLSQLTALQYLSLSGVDLRDLAISPRSRTSRACNRSTAQTANWI